MSRCDAELLRQNYSVLLKNISTLHVLSHLSYVGVFNQEDCNRVLKSRKPNRVLLYLLKKKGSKTFAEFLNSLNPEFVKQLNTLENDISNLKI